MSEPHIKFGLDAYGRYVYIEEASPLPHYYRCPVCEEFLQVRKGDIRIWYFAHTKAEIDSHACLLRTDVGLNEWIKTVKRSPIERDEKARKLQIIVLTIPYTNRLNLYGLLPAPNWEDFSNIEQIENTINSITLSCECLEKPVSPNSFHPNEAEVLIPLNPDAKLFKITISSSPTIQSIVGVWSAPNIKSNDVFVGSSNRAVRVESNYRVKQGETIFVVLKEQLDSIPPKVQIFRLGSFFVLSFEIDQDTDQLAREFLSHVEIDPNAFQVDVILPPYAEPHAIAPIEGVAGYSALIAIIPPKNLDPSFEVVSVPLEKEKEIILPNTGLGNVRFYCPTFPNRGSRRLSIHWGGRHKYLNLYTQMREQQEIKAAWKNDNKIGIRLLGIGNDSNLIIPWSVSYLYPMILYIKNKNMKGIGFEFIGPNGLVFDLEGYSQKLGIIREDNISMEKAHSVVSSWQEEGVNKIVISYGPLGKIPIEFRYNLTNEEIESRLLELPELPKKANRELMRSILGLDKNASIPGGAKKKIRHAILKLRKEKYVQ